MGEINGSFSYTFKDLKDTPNLHSGITETITNLNHKKFNVVLFYVEKGKLRVVVTFYDIPRGSVQILDNSFNLNEKSEIHSMFVKECNFRKELKIEFSYRINGLFNQIQTIPQNLDFQEEDLYFASKQGNTKEGLESITIKYNTDIMSNSVKKYISLRDATSYQSIYEIVKKKFNSNLNYDNFECVLCTKSSFNEIDKIFDKTLNPVDFSQSLHLLAVRPIVSPERQFQLTLDYVSSDNQNENKGKYHGNRRNRNRKIKEIPQLIKERIIFVRVVYKNLYKKSYPYVFPIDSDIKICYIFDNIKKIIACDEEQDTGIESEILLFVRGLQGERFLSPFDNFNTFEMVAKSVLLCPEEYGKNDELSLRIGWITNEK
ncbi:hypothetical protein TRFO_28698 [Tritrichomonas foetus]|uniref:Uncharacterized protein n=1 Tax=Tritrichomonas foetus TaxID=1144522 RepID=A0A1J4JXP3_9EUKA|nr:hypothetical protein TRFO_28698 [Tritrichomonas foetus]|eukprot:OHT03921.1 hypothetical protein TRFO_28698 [Tritrichomonas foetus]